MFRLRKNHTLYKLILFICLFFSLPVLAGNIKNYKFHTLSPEGGFYYDGVKSIQQDNDGFIWIVMENDLFRFDGYQFRRYYSYLECWILRINGTFGMWNWMPADICSFQLIKGFSFTIRLPTLLKECSSRIR